MKGKEIVDLAEMEEKDSSSYGLLGQRLMAIRKKISIPPMFLVSNSVLNSLVEGDQIPKGKHIPWRLEIDIAQRFDMLESPAVRILPSPSYEHSIPDFSTVSSKSELVVSIESCFRSFFDVVETERREEMGVKEFGVAVIIQKLFDPKSSGTLTQSKKEASIVAVHGLPIDFEGADSFVIDKGGRVKSRSEAPQERKWVLGEKNIELVRIEEGSWNMHKLTERQISRLGTLGRRVQGLLREQVIVEWYLVRNTFYITSLYPAELGAGVR